VISTGRRINSIRERLTISWSTAARNSRDRCPEAARKELGNISEIREI
jgi:hypothetical protein